MILDILLLISIVGVVLREGLNGAISAETSTYVLIGLTALVALARSTGMGFFRLLHRVAASFGFIIFLVKSNSHENPQLEMTLYALIATLVIMMFGFYLMFRGVFGQRRSR